MGSELDGTGVTFATVSERVEGEADFVVIDVVVPVLAVAWGVVGAMEVFAPQASLVKTVASIITITVKNFRNCIILSLDSDSTFYPATIGSFN